MRMLTAMQECHDPGPPIQGDGRFHCIFMYLNAKKLTFFSRVFFVVFVIHCFSVGCGRLFVSDITCRQLSYPILGLQLLLAQQNVYIFRILVSSLRMVFETGFTARISQKFKAT